MQINLFSEHEHLALPGGGDLYFYRQWLATEYADSLFAELLERTPWEQPDISIAGRTMLIPRRQAWYGAQGAHFRYSGTDFAPIPFTDTLKTLKEKLENQCKASFNSVLINHYRDQHDSVGWHADDEKEFGDAPIIGSLSLGEARRFLFKPKSHFYGPSAWAKGKRSLSFELQHGDLVIMGPNVQANWLHCVPKEEKRRDQRINLTFRKVIY